MSRASPAYVHLSFCIRGDLVYTTTFCVLHSCSLIVPVCTCSGLYIICSCVQSLSMYTYLRGYIYFTYTPVHIVPLRVQIFRVHKSWCVHVVSMYTCPRCLNVHICWRRSCSGHELVMLPRYLVAPSRPRTEGVECCLHTFVDSTVLFPMS